MDFDSGASWFANGVPGRGMSYMAAPRGSQFYTAGGGMWSGGTFNGTFMMKSCTLRGGVKFHY